MIKKAHVALCVSFAASVMAIHARTVYYNQSSPAHEVSPQGITTFDNRESRSLRSMKHANQSTNTLTVSFKYDQARLKPSSVRVFNADYHPNRMYLVEDSTISIDVPPGIYDVVCGFSNLDKYNPENPGPHQITVILENVDITKNTAVCADASTATNRIRFSSFNPDGQQSILPDYDPETGKKDATLSNAQQIN